ncbi:MAG: hypothetical protein ACYCVB_12995, partial [Bacilli bacterium]
MGSALLGGVIGWNLERVMQRSTEVWGAARSRRAAVGERFRNGFGRKREKRLSVRLSREFALERTAADARLWVAATGGVKVYLDGRECGEIPDHPQNAAQFSRVESFPGSLSPGLHRLEIAAECAEPMPVNAIG